MEPHLATVTASASAPNRFRLGRRPLLCVLAAILVAMLAVVLMQLFVPTTREAGSPLRQSAAIFGTALLFVPLLFSIAKRGGLSRHPPAWFVAHVLASVAGLLLVSFHALGGQFLSPPGAVLALLFFLALQGTLARIFLSAHFSQQFASRPVSYHQVDSTDRVTLAEIIERKRALLPRFDASASEALFSPNLRHALRHPWLTLRYARLAAAEARLVGARLNAGRVLSWWRRLHIAAAILFFLGVAAHVVVVTFFAGYAAAGRPIEWWHIAAWGA